MIDALNQLDTHLFLFLNGLHTQWLDPLMWIISGKLIWIPLYLVLLFFLIKQYGKQVWIPLLGVALLILLADQTASGLLKEAVQRLRPSRNPSLEGLVHIVNNYRGGKYGFVSSHASNSFAIAVFFSLIFRYRPVSILLICWAIIVSYSRIYLGVHYPGDVICGALIGCGWAVIVYSGVIWTKRKITKSATV